MRLLEKRGELDVSGVAAELGSSSRTVYRDLAVLERFGVPLSQEPAGRRVRWRVVEGGYQPKATLGFAWSDLIALAAGAELLESFAGTLLHDAARAALAKIEAAVPPALVARARMLVRHLSADGGARVGYSAQGGVVRTLAGAIERGETVELTYRKAGARAFERRRVDPYHLHIQSGALYLIGLCHERGALRTFAVHRARVVARTGERFERRGGLDPRTLLHGSFGPYSGKRERVRLRFAPEVAAVVAERRLHASQVTQWRADGSLDVTVEAPLSPALVAFVVGFGGSVVVLGPGALAKRVLEEHRSAIAAAGTCDPGCRKRVVGVGRQGRRARTRKG